MTHGIFGTTDIDLAAYLTAVTGRDPSVFYDHGHATFHFREDVETEARVVAYATGAAMANVRRLLAARRRLFHEVRRLKTRDSHAS